VEFDGVMPIEELDPKGALGDARRELGGDAKGSGIKPLLQGRQI